MPCLSDRDCSGVTAAPRCDHGFCRGSVTPIDDAGAGDSNDEVTTDDASDGSNEGATGPDACEHGAIAGNEVVLLGDSFIAEGHQITSSLEQLARASGSLPSAEQYRDYASTATANLAGMPGGIATQYASAAGESAVKVVIMDGGGADVLVGTCPDPPTADCPIVQDAIASLNSLLSQMAAGGVQEVVYFFYPDVSDATLQAKLNVLRPLAQNVCTNTIGLSCHWLDLRPVFAGHESEYYLPDGLNPTTAGAEATAHAIQSLMQQECIAQ